MEKELNICFTADNNYVKYMATTIVSILKNVTENEKIIFHIITGDISDENKEKILKLKRIKDFQIEYHTPNVKKCKELFNQLKRKRNLSDATFYRLSIPTLIPNVDKILYLDSDIIVNINLRELFSIDIENYYVMAAVDLGENMIKNYFFKGYFNSGVMMINNKMWIKNNLEKELMKNYNPDFRFAEQDLLNEVLRYKIKFIDIKYNLFAPKKFFPKYLTENQIRNNYKNSIIHFVGDFDKPWQDSISIKDILFVDLYWKYYQYTPWFEEDQMETFKIILTQQSNSINIASTEKYNEISNKYNEISNKYNEISNKYNEINNKYNEISNKYNKMINTIAWWIPIKKWRDSFRNKILRAEQSRAEQSRAELIIPYVPITYVFIIIQNIKNYNLCCNTKLQHRFFVA